MATNVIRDDLVPGNIVAQGRLDGAQGAVSWGAIFAGAAAAAALSVVLVVLGGGLGFASVSPWTADVATAKAFGISSAIWLALTALAASGLGGYIAGRLRTRWTHIHGDENYFRDTAHGFLAWCVATLLTVSMFGSLAGGLAAAGSAAVGAGAAGAGMTTMRSMGTARSEGGDANLESDSGVSPSYFVDSLYRRDTAAAPPSGLTAASASAGAASLADDGQRSTSAETRRIFATALRSDAGVLPADDLRYVAQGIAQRTGLSQQDAEKRVSDTYSRLKAATAQAAAKAKEAADVARKAAAWTALWIVVALLIGALSASFAAMVGGRRRDL